MRLLALCAVLMLAWPSTTHAKRHQQWPEWRHDWWAPERTYKRKTKRKRVQTVRKRAQTWANLGKPGHRGLVTVPTAAGIRITVSPSFAPRITAFIADLVEQGYRPRSIHCWARGGHVYGSRHYSGNACDIDQTGWGRTSRPMYRVTALARKHGLRDGDVFGDAGHIDDGRPLSRYAHRGVNDSWRPRTARSRPDQIVQAQLARSGLH